MRESIPNYDFLSDAVVYSIAASSDVSDQPKSLNETILGAKNRAKNALVNCDYSFGIESGIMQVPHTKSNYMNVCACAIYNGSDYYIGLSSAFECPPEIIKLVLEENIEIDSAFYKSKITKDPEIGRSQGAVGVLTKGRLMRKEYIKQAIIMALILFENQELYP